MPPHPPALQPVLLIDDTDDDLCLLRRYLIKAGVTNPVRSFDDSLRARDYLTTAVNPPNPELMPCIVFTDLRMPKQNGIELIKWARSDPRFDSVCFVIISTSQNDRDRACARVAGADDYLVKFPDSAVLVQLISAANGRAPITDSKLNSEFEI